MTDRTGTVLMEAVLCLPLLLFLVTGIVQFSRIWEAKLLARHAAYNAARAALVYNTGEYARVDDKGRIEFAARGGPAWAAAVNTLAWKSATFDSAGGAHDHSFPGFGGDRDSRIGSSAFVRSRGATRDGQVSIVPGASWESNGLVRVTVRFKLPLLFSVFALGAVQGDSASDPAPLVHDTAADVAPRSAWSDDIPHLTLEESCVLPKPWSTRWYPRVSTPERRLLEFDAP